MKFGKYMEKNKIKEFNQYYVNYKLLKKNLKKCNTEEFYKLLNVELNKLNKFINENKNIEVTNKLKDFLVLNYMALFKSIKKHDKKLSKLTKINFFILFKIVFFINII